METYQEYKGLSETEISMVTRQMSLETKPTRLHRQWNCGVLLIETSKTLCHLQPERVLSIFNFGALLKKCSDLGICLFTQPFFMMSSCDLDTLVWSLHRVVTDYVNLRDSTNAQYRHYDQQRLLCVQNRHSVPPWLEYHPINDKVGIAPAHTELLNEYVRVLNLNVATIQHDWEILDILCDGSDICFGTCTLPLIDIRPRSTCTVKSIMGGHISVPFERMVSCSTMSLFHQALWKIGYDLLQHVRFFAGDTGVDVLQTMMTDPKYILNFTYLSLEGTAYSENLQVWMSTVLDAELMMSMAHENELDLSRIPSDRLTKLVDFREKIEQYRAHNRHEIRALKRYSSGDLIEPRNKTARKTV